MKLPNDSIGISDLTGWQECPRRMSFGMRRHTEDGEPPEDARNPNTRYGTAVHDGVEQIEKQGLDNEQAVAWLMANGHRWITPEVAAELKADFDTYRHREPLGVRVVMAEAEIRVPLLTYKGTQVYYRGRIDRLYQDLLNPSTFYHRDYKSSRWRRSQEEVDEDLQMRSYSWALREWMPEIGTLYQTYDQLKFGEVERRQDSQADLEATREWLEMASIAVLDDDEVGPDGLLVPSLNDWCAYCPILGSCAVVADLTDYAIAEIAALAPPHKTGRNSGVNLDPDLFDVYVEQLDRVSTAKGVLEAFERAVKDRLKQMPDTQRESYGYELRAKSIDVFSADAMRAAHKLLGDEEFYRLASMSKVALQSAVGRDEDKLKLILGMADRVKGSQYVQRKRGRSRS